MSNFQEAMFIQGATPIPDSGVSMEQWAQRSIYIYLSPILKVENTLMLMHNIRFLQKNMCSTLFEEQAHEQEG